jgi:glutathione S-transferase
MNRSLDVATSFASSVLELGAGLLVRDSARQPEQLLELYEFESCPFCRRVREALSVMDLDAKILPCPPGGMRFRPEVAARGGKAQFPFLVDPNTDRWMYESSDIVRYLASTYGDGGVPLGAKLGPLDTLRSSLSSLPRLGKVRARPSKAPEKPLELWSFEASPFCRIVRERLSSLELPYVLHNVAKRSKKRDAFVARSGRMMVPFLVDPNTDTAMFESAEMLRYLDDTYAA